MTFQFDTLHITHQLTTGITYPDFLGYDKDVIRGSVYLEGPTVIGNESSFDYVEGSVMIGPCTNEDSPIPWMCDTKLKFIPEWSITACSASGVGAEKYGLDLAHPYSLVVKSGTHKVRDTKCKDKGYKGNSIIEIKSEGAAFFDGDVDIYGYNRIKGKLSVVDKADFADDVIIQKNIILGVDLKMGGNLCADGDGYFDGTLDGIPTGRLLDRIEIADARPKPFDMVHPSKEGWRLRYACIEGPEVGVYFRGRVKNRTEIDIPWYWKDLVHVDSISVQLQPIGAHQDVIVKRWDSEKIYLQSKGGMPIDCFYHVYAERKDVNALVTEYVGETWKDYPDQEYNAEEFASKINTLTL